MISVVWSLPVNFVDKKDELTSVVECFDLAA